MLVWAALGISDNTYTITAQKEKRKMAEGDFTHPSATKTLHILAKLVILVIEELKPKSLSIL
jgi:hypothetical protein